MKQPKLIPVSKGNWALVDEEYYEMLNQFKWYFSGGGKNRGYAATSMRKDDGKRKTIYMHQLIMPVEGKVTDHRNGNTLDNRRSNLRHCTKSLDRANCIHKANPDRVTSSRFKGVSFKKSIKRWIARIGSGTNREWLGCFATEELAAQAYNKAARSRWANFARLNDVKV